MFELLENNEQSDNEPIDETKLEIITIINEESSETQKILSPTENYAIINDLASQIEESNKKIEELQNNISETKDIIYNLFAKDQIDFLSRNSCDRHIWTSSTIKQSLELYLACGKTGYEEILRQGYPFPEIDEEDGKYYVNSVLVKSNHVEPLVGEQKCK